MGFISPFLGLSGNGANFQAQGTNIQQPVSLDQANQTYGQAQSGLSQQQAFLNALQAQGGIGNQSNVFGQQQALANQLQGIGNGTGPNPALAQLQQATGQNIASQAALMGSQRGVGANPGLLARQAAQQGGNLQQQAVGQGAVLQAQQQMAALQALQNQQANMANLASQQVGQQSQGLGQYNQLAQGLNAQNLGALQGTNAANVAMQSNINNANQSQAGINTGVQKDVFKGITEAIGKGVQAGGMAEGGQVPNLKENYGPKSRIAQHLCNYKNGGKVAGKAKVKGDSPKNDAVPAMLSPGEIVVPRSHASDPEMAASFAHAVASRMKRK